MIKSLTYVKTVTEMLEVMDECRELQDNLNDAFGKLNTEAKANIQIGGSTVVDLSVFGQGCVRQFLVARQEELQEVMEEYDNKLKEIEELLR